MTDCKHQKITTFVLTDSGEPAGLWACADCGHKFVPIDLEMERDAASCQMMRDALTELRDRLRDHPAYAELTEDEEMDIGGDTAELSYLVRMANDALDCSAGNEISDSGKIPSTTLVDEQEEMK
jgi:hypothetical protein